MTDQEKIQKIRQITLSPFNKINEALKTSYGDVDKAIKLLEEQKHTSTADMNNRVSNAGLVYSYVHQGRIGAMIVLACQTDFVARNPEFEKLAKDICMHIVSAPIIPIYADETTIPKETLDFWKQSFINAAGNKPQNIIDKIVLGKLKKQLEDVCLVNQKFVINPDITVGQHIKASATTFGENIVVKKFVRMKNDIGYVREDGNKA